MKTILVTGGAGFIGCNFVRLALSRPDLRAAVIDKLTYAGHPESLEDLTGNPRYSFIEADIADPKAMRTAFETHQPDALVNFAAETHVDRSIDGPADFVRTNVVGTFVLLDTAKAYWETLAPDRKAAFRFLHVSTDEVYGSLGAAGLFSETTPYAPNSPYSATKAGADHLVRAYFETYKLPTLITNCSNNYGPYQFPEKLIPLALLNAIEGKDIPVYGDGKNVRDWLYVEDHCAGILLALEKGAPGGKYNIGGNNERTNLEILTALCGALERELPAKENAALRARGKAGYRDLITFVADRPGHDRRYAIDGSKIRKELGWKPGHELSAGLAKTVRWYLDHAAWREAVTRGRYGRERLGLQGAKT